MEIQNGKSQNMENNCHIPDLVEASPYEENRGLNQVYKV